MIEDKTPCAEGMEVALKYKNETIAALRQRVKELEDVLKYYSKIEPFEIKIGGDIYSYDPSPARLVLEGNKK